MPKLSRAKARSVADAEGGTFELLEPGTYRARLVDVQVKEGKKGPYWSWQYKLDEKGRPGQMLWNNTSLSEDSEWKIKETFDAFGVPPDTDTDELAGEAVLLQVGIRTIQTGARAGQESNDVQAVLPLDTIPGKAEKDEESEDEEEATPPPPRSKAKATAATAASGKKKPLPVDDEDDEPPF